jgi:NAD-dependent deacetylase
LEELGIIRRTPIRQETSFVNIVAITGSGISAASGIKTYRAEGSGWDKYAQGIAHARSYGNHLPELWRHWTAMGRAIEVAEPNDAHLALARAGASVITQNVDGLHQKAGSETVIELHGDMRSMRCLRCRQSMPCDLTTDSPVCANCGSVRVRTNAVLFGEKLLRRDYNAAEQLLRAADLVMVIGTSGEVYPARGFVNEAIERKTKTILFDIAPWDDGPAFDAVVLGPADETVPSYVENF